MNPEFYWSADANYGYFFFFFFFSAFNKKRMYDW